MGHKIAWHLWQTYEISYNDQKKLLFYSCHATCPMFSASQLLAELLSHFGACSARCSGRLGCVLAAGSGLTWRREACDSTRSPSGIPHWEMALHCRFGCVCHGSFVIQRASAPSVMGLVDWEWEELGWQQGEGDAHRKSLWALLTTNVAQWADLKGFEGRKWRGVSLNSSATECKNWF